VGRMGHHIQQTFRAEVYRFLASDDGRARFWAESARATNGVITFQFPNGLTATGRSLEQAPSYRFVLEYLGGSIVTFELTGWRAFRRRQKKHSFLKVLPCNKAYATFPVRRNTTSCPNRGVRLLSASKWP
jgi:hypothetical protein